MQVTQVQFLAKLHEPAPRCKNFGTTWHQTLAAFVII